MTKKVTNFRVHGPSFKQTRGAALVSWILLAGFFGIVAAVVARRQEITSETIDLYRDRGDLADLRRYVGNLIDCEETMKKNHRCVEGAPVALYRGPGEVLVTKQGGQKETRLAIFRLRAKCGPTSSEFLVEYREDRARDCDSAGKSCWAPLTRGLLVCD